MNVVITGVSRGIGLELTRESLGKGDQVVAVARKPNESKDLVALQSQFPKTLQVLAADVGIPEAAQKIAAAVEAWPHVDVLINNAGVFQKGAKREDFLISFQVNTLAPYFISTALLPKLRKSAAAKIANITSLMGSIDDNTSGGMAAYRASKCALNMINKCLAVENEWLTTIVVHPGWVKTDMGGAAAPVETLDSVAGIWKIIRGLQLQDTGQFLDFRGKFLPW